MALIQWSSEYSVNIESMDLEHQKLVGILNTLFDALKVGKNDEILAAVFQELIGYVDEHFRNEETLMREHSYPGLSAHINEHILFENKIKEEFKAFRAGSLFVTVDLIHFLKNWLVEHIQKSDKHYGEFLGAQG